MRIKTIVLGLALAMCSAAAASCAAPSPTPAYSGPARVFKFSMIQSEESGWYKGATKFAELVAQRSNNRITINVFANGSLASGDQVKELELLQNGSIDFAFQSTTLYTNLDQRFNVVNLPWIFASYADVDKVLTGPLGQEMLRIPDSKNVVGLALGENGFRQLSNSKREVKTPDDIKGLKVRIPSVKAFTSTFNALGATPVTMSLPQVYDALQQGKVDGQENAFDTLVSSKFYDVQKYVTVWNYSYGALILGAYKPLWDGLDEEAQRILRQAALDATAYQVQESRKSTDAQVQMLKNKGLIITVLTPEQIQAFRAKVAPVYAEYEPIVGKELLDRFLALNK